MDGRRRVQATKGALAAVAMFLFLLAVPSLANAAPPTGLTGMALDGRVELAWQPVPGATGYTVYRGTSAGAITTPLTGTPLTPLNPTANGTFTDVSPVNATTYHYAVRAIVAGIESANSRTTIVRPRARTCTGNNVVVMENCLPGDSTWDITVASTNVGAFATAQSIDHGGSVDLKVTAPGATTVDIEVFRSGGYGTAGGRLFSRIPGVPVPAQPACTSNASFGLLECANWSVTQTLTTTQNWPSGVYLVKVTRTDTGANTHVLLVVRDDQRHADLLYGVPTTTYQAYNNYGGKSLYPHNSTSALTVSGTGRAVKVSFDRPYLQQHDSIAHDWYTRTDVATVAWLERAGYDISYTAVSDLERSGPSVLDHRVFISGAHDEYWSAAMRTALENGREHGTRLFFTGANELYWKVRFEPGTSSGVQDRVLVNYKTSQSGPADPSGIHTGTWRDPAGANKPENALTGVMYVGQKDYTYFPLRVTAAQGTDRVWRYTGLDTQPTGGSTTFGTSLLGWEWDRRVNNGQEPPGVTALSDSPANGDILQDNGGVWAPGSTTSQGAKYTWSSGALVVSTGTNHWNRGLALNALGQGEPDRRIQQATTNILIDMGAVPETPAANMILDDPALPPLVSQRSPAANATGVAPTTTVRATFSRPMDGASITSSSFTLTRRGGGAVAATVSYDPITLTATLTPTAALDLDTTFDVRLAPTVRAANGVALGTASTWSFTTRPPDTTPPVVSITTPSAGSTVLGTVDLRASASDETAVANVRFLLDGAALGSTLTNAPYNTTWDVRTVSAGLHTLSAIARDTSGNETTSAPVQVTVDPTGLVAAYGFEETTGTAANDSSGKGNGGTLVNGTVRSATGRHGRSLSFDGVNDQVNVADAASLDLTNAMTLEAWVNPNVAGGGAWRTVLMKESPSGLAYGLYSNIDANRPSVHVHTSTEVDVRGTAQVAANVWTHLAATYDGATLRLYVNGTQVATRTLTGAMATTASALRIGGNAVWGEYFRGLIDEVRVYRRVLTAAEITADMNTAIVNAAPDTQAPTVPGGVVATGGVGEVRLTWTASTDNVGIDRYSVHRSTSVGFTPTEANRIADVTTTSFTNGGIPAGTYHYRIVAYDIAGNASAPSASVSGTATADATPPTVSVTAPGAGATVSGSISVTATASDVGGVAGVRLRVDGNDIGSEQTSAPYTVTWDTALLPNGTHTLTAVARDTIGNQATSAPVNVTVNNLPPDPTGLVAAYGFEEPTGSATTDSSPSSNHGTLTNGTSRVATGRFGAALSFDGVDDMVTIPDSPSLDLTTAMTLEAWVRPTDAGGGAWRTVAIKEQPSALVYALYANLDANRPSAHVFTSGEIDTRGTAQVAANTWTHLAALFDGLTLRLFVNGVQVSSTAATGSMVTSSGALRLGGNSVWGEWFKGTLDEIRIYRRALSAAEVQTDMNRAVVGP